MPNADEVERRALEHTEKKEWAQARAAFEEMLNLDLSDKRRAKVLYSITATYQREGNTQAAFTTISRAIRHLENVPNIDTEKAEMVFGFNWTRDDLAGVPGAAEFGQLLKQRWKGSIAAFLAGALAGAALEKEISIRAGISQYAGGVAFIGGLLGFAIFKEFLWSAPRLSVAVSLLYLASLAAFYIGADFKNGTFILALLLLVPTMTFFSRPQN